MLRRCTLFHTNSQGSKPEELPPITERPESFLLGNRFTCTERNPDRIVYSSPTYVAQFKPDLILGVRPGVRVHLPDHPTLASRASVTGSHLQAACVGAFGTF